MDRPKRTRKAPVRMDEEVPAPASKKNKRKTAIRSKKKKEPSQTEATGSQSCRQKRKKNQEQKDKSSTVLPWTEVKDFMEEVAAHGSLVHLLSDVWEEKDLHCVLSEATLRTKFVDASDQESIFTKDWQSIARPLEKRPSSKILFTSCERSGTLDIPDPAESWSWKVDLGRLKVLPLHGGFKHVDKEGNIVDGFDVGPDHADIDSRIQKHLAAHGPNTQLSALQALMHVNAVGIKPMKADAKTVEDAFHVALGCDPLDVET